MVGMPPASAAQGGSIHADTGFGLSLLLGTDYEKRKHKLKQELQLDYRQHVTKEKELKTSQNHPEHQGLSLPIGDNTAVQERLRDERNREYNLFLQEQAQNKRLRRGQPIVTTEASDAVCIPPPVSSLPISNVLTNDHPPPKERPASRKDAATLTEEVDDGRRTEAWIPGHRGQKRWQIIRRKAPYSSEEEFDSDIEEEYQFRRRRGRGRYSPEPVYKEERRTREHKANRDPQDTKEVEASGGHDQNNVLFGKSDQQVPDKMTSAAGSRPPARRDKAEFATGLMIGVTEEQSASQLRKERYKQELLKQIAEKKENKMRERRLELGLTQATDSEKKEDRPHNLWAVSQGYNSWKRVGKDLEDDPNPQMRDVKQVEDSGQNIPGGASRVDYTSPLSQLTGTMALGSGVRATQSVPPLDYFTEDYHGDFSNVLGGVAMPRVAPPPPPAPPTVTDHYKTPHDAAYYYYGARNPLDHSLLYYQNGASEGQQQSRSYYSTTVKPAPVRPSGLTEAPDRHGVAPLNVSEVLAERSKQGRENVQSYQEALRQQIKDREEQRTKEKKEKEDYDAKIGAEMMAYNPWGRIGGGAPIKDQKGNLISNLTQMHKNNNESTRYHMSRASGHTQNYMRDCLTPRPEPTVTPLQELSGVIQAGYKEELEKQIQQKKEQQEREKMQLKQDNELEERRLEKERARMKLEYEEEQKKLKEAARRQETQSWIHEPSVKQRKKEREARQEQETEKKTPEKNKEERNQTPCLPREPSPPIPTLQKKQRNLVASRPPSVDIQLSSRTDRSVSAPGCQEVAAKAPQRQDGHQEVIRELSTLRTYLRTQQRQLEAQLGHNNSQNNPHGRPKGRVRVNTFRMPPRRDDEPTTRIQSSAAAHSNVQNIREFNQLKYRDTASREEVRHMYPDPPTDAQSLDIQQQALLREQQRKIRLMRWKEEDGFLDQELNRYQPRNNSGHNRDYILPSESAFIDVYSGDVSEEQAQQRHQPSAGDRVRRGARRRQDYDEAADGMDQREHPSSQGTKRYKDKPHEQYHAGDHYRRQEEPSGDEADVLSLRSAIGRRVSVDTVATEPWLRPGTSDAVKQSVRRERQERSMGTTG